MFVFYWFKKKDKAQRGHKFSLFNIHFCPDIPGRRKTMFKHAQMLNGDTVGFPDERHVFYGIFIFFLAVFIVVKGNAGDVQLDQAP